jgi:predicted RecA/RadA family phage recombinase
MRPPSLGMLNGAPLDYSRPSPPSPTAGAYAEVETVLTGVHLLPKATGEITAGALVYWDVSESNCVATDGAGNVLLGAAVELAGSSAASVKVRLNGVAIA